MKRRKGFKDFNEKGVPVGAVTDATAATGATAAFAQALVTLCWSSGAAGIAFGRLPGTHALAGREVSWGPLVVF